MTSDGRSASHLAAFSAAVMIAQQVAGKATRDALFLSHFGAEELPEVMIASAALSVVGVLGASAAMQRFGPARLVPVAFALSGALFAAEWTLVPVNPGLAAWVIFLHIAVFGAIVISGFWSVINERFDPHAAKKAVARIAAAATFGGLLGGLSAERVAVLLEPRSMLLILAGLNALCALSMLRVGSAISGRATAPGDEPTGPVAGLQILKELPYLQKLAALVALVAMTAALLDFALKAQAAERLESGETLMQFFALFYTATGLLTFVVQSLLAKRALSRFGLDGAIAMLPALVVVSGVFATAVTRMWTVVMVRGIETVLANSFFRSGYELLYTPLAPHRKRATKTIIDVAFDRLGDAVGSGAILLVLLLAPRDGVVSTVLGLAAGVAALAFLVSRTLQRGYVGALAESLRTGSVELADREVLDATTRRTLSETTLALDRERLLAEVAALRARQGKTDVITADRPRPPSPAPPPVSDRELREQVDALLGADDAARSRVLASESLDPRLVAFLLPLLVHSELGDQALRALRRIAPRAVGQLVDALLDPRQSSSLRRRLPRVLQVCDSGWAARGLLDGLDDERFEVRYQCAQALSRMLERNPHLAPPTERIMKAAEAELEVDREVWESRQLLEDEPEEQSPWLDDVLRRRLHRSLEHVFTILSLGLDREPLLLSLRALSSDDEGLRGTALEYLENVLPEEVHLRLLPYLDESARMRGEQRRTREQIVDELLRSMDSLRLDRDEVLRASGSADGDG